MFAHFRGRLRRLLFGPKQRALGRRTVKPAIGAQIVCGDLRMSVQAGTSEELWRWLLERGWREQSYRPDRRHYRDVPSRYVTALIDGAADKRESLLRTAIENAVQRRAS